MDQVNPDQIHSLLLNPTFWILAVWLASEYWRGLKSKNKEYMEALKENSVEISRLTLAMARLETKLEPIQAAIQQVPKIQSDLNFLHSKVRSIGLPQEE